ncbi:hypothetical protein DFH27DRAFT_47746 [Peziza echinospora]|nr:hypothetical protein DFH27DRAFT_47746 [Peziza echinospora]
MSAPIKIDHFQSKQLPRIITTHGTPPDGRSRTYLDKAEEENDAVPSSPMSWSAEILELGHHNRASNPPTFRIPRKVVSSSVVESPIDQNKHKSIVPSVSHGDKSSQWSIPSAPLPVRKQRDYNNNIVGGHGHGGGMVTPTSPRDRFERNMEYELALGKRGTVKSKQSSASSVMVDVGEATVSHDGVRQVYMRKKSQVDRGTRGIGPGLLVEEYHDNSPGGGAGVAGGTVGGCAGKLDSDCLSPMSFYSQDQQQQHHHHQHHQIPPLPRTLDSVPTIPATLSYPPRSQQSSLNTPREIPRRQDSSAPLTHPYRSNELESARLTPQLQSIPQTTQNGVQVSYSRPGFSPAPAPQSQYRPDGSSIGQGNGGGSDCESLWDGNDASDNPRNWGMKKKSFNTLVVSLYTFVMYVLYFPDKNINWSSYH